MKRKAIFFISVVAILCCNTLSYSYEVAESFIFPLANYVNDNCLDWGDYGSGDYSGKRHLADDRCVSTGTSVRVVANGRIKFTLDDPTGITLYPRYYYGLIVVEHQLRDGSKVCSIYGHTKPVEIYINGEIRKLVVGDEVSIGQKIGEIVDYPPSSEHIHFSIYNGKYQTEEGIGSILATWMFGYCIPSEWPGSYLDPVKFIEDHYMVGHYFDGFHTDGTSQAFLDSYNKHFSKIGWPFNNGGGVYVHQWGPILIQDYQGDICSDHYGTDGRTAVILNDFSAPYKAYLVKEGFWNFYKENNGPSDLGKPLTEEITAQYAKNPYSHYTDLIQAGDIITVQKFERVCESGCITERRTLVWKNGIEPQRFAVGEFSIGSEHCSNGVQMYVTRDSDPAHDIPWPQKGVLTPTGKWFTKPGIYDFVLHDENGQRKSGWGLTVPITEGNSQSTGDSWGDTTTDQDDLDAGLYSPENLQVIGYTDTQAMLTWDRGLNPPEYANLRYKLIRNGQEIAVTNLTSYTDKPLTPSTTYHYQVIAFLDADNESNPSNEITIISRSAIVTAGYLNAPTEVGYLNLFGTLEVSWNHDQMGAYPGLTFEVFSTKNGYASPVATTKSFYVQLPGISPTVTSYLKVRARNGSDISKFSDEIRIGPEPPAPVTTTTQVVSITTTTIPAATTTTAIPVTTTTVPAEPAIPVEIDIDSIPKILRGVPILISNQETRVRLNKTTGQPITVGQGINQPLKKCMYYIIKPEKDQYLFCYTNKEGEKYVTRCVDLFTSLQVYVVDFSYQDYLDFKARNRK